jgi:hypothetical protein
LRLWIQFLALATVNSPRNKQGSVNIFIFGPGASPDARQEEREEVGRYRCQPEVTVAEPEKEAVHYYTFKQRPEEPFPVRSRRN